MLHDMQLICIATCGAIKLNREVRERSLFIAGLVGTEPFRYWFLFLLNNHQTSLPSLDVPTTTGRPYHHQTSLPLLDVPTITRRPQHHWTSLPPLDVTTTTRCPYHYWTSLYHHQTYCFNATHIYVQYFCKFAKIHHVCVCVHVCMHVCYMYTQLYIYIVDSTGSTDYRHNTDLIYLFMS